jgi:hypothetical protein
VPTSPNQPFLPNRFTVLGPKIAVKIALDSLVVSSHIYKEFR